MTDMMLTGRVYNAVDGERIGLAQYLVPTGTALDKAFELARRIATNAPLTNYALMHALPRIAEQPADQGFFTEAMMAAIAQSRARGQGPRARLSRRSRRQGAKGLSGAGRLQKDPHGDKTP
jgi:enoyl-CoA hydratase/carnithine racemase